MVLKLCLIEIKKIYKNANVLQILICCNLFNTNCIENCVGNYF